MQSPLKQVVNFLLKNGADPNVQDDRGQTPLHLAMPLGASSVVVALLNHGADEAIKDNNNQTAADVTQDEWGQY